MAGIVRVTSLKILGVITVTNELLASDRVRDVINNCAKSLYALRVLRARGMCDYAFQAIYRSVINAKLLYACSAWWGFTNATDRHRVDGFQRRSIRCGYCPPDLPTFEEQCCAADQALCLFVSLCNRPNSLSASSLIPITYCTTYYRHLQLPHSTMICDLEPATDNYQFTLDT